MHASTIGPHSNTSSHIPPGHLSTQAAQKPRTVEGLETQPIGIASAPTGPTPGLPAESTAVTDAKGVLGLLLDGHFQGVADVRLRINFHEEISAIEAGATREAAGTSLTALADAVAGQLDTLVASRGLSEKQVAAIGESGAGFQARIEELGASFASGDLSSDALLSETRAAFDGLLQQLDEILAPKTDGAPEGDAPVESGDTPAEGDAPAEDSWATFRETLVASFDSTHAALDTSLSETSALPELSEPRGNGVAYAKFVEMYEALRAPAPSEDTPPSAPLAIG